MTSGTSFQTMHSFKHPKGISFLQAITRKNWNKTDQSRASLFEANITLAWPSTLPPAIALLGPSSGLRMAENHWLRPSARHPRPSRSCHLPAVQPHPPQSCPFSRQAPDILNPSQDHRCTALLQDCLPSCFSSLATSFLSCKPADFHFKIQLNHHLFSKDCLASLHALLSPEYCAPTFFANFLKTTRLWIFCFCVRLPYWPEPEERNWLIPGSPTPTISISPKPVQCLVHNWFSINVYGMNT